jgi:hypothetical protein
VPAIGFAGSALAELDVQVWVSGIFAADRTQDVTLLDAYALKDADSDAVEVDIHDEQVFFAVGRVNDFQHDMR